MFFITELLVLPKLLYLPFQKKNSFICPTNYLLTHITSIIICLVWLSSFFYKKRNLCARIDGYHVVVMDHHLWLLCFHDGCKYQNLTRTFLGSAPFAFPLGLWLLCALAVCYLAASTVCFRVRHDSRLLDFFNSSFIEPADENEKI